MKQRNPQASGNTPNYTFTIATEAAQFEQIHRLNYATFVEEIPQHRPNPERRLVDRFHSENRYVICVYEGEIVGMLALRGARPFSLDAKLDALDDYLPAGRRVCEIRLLAVRPEHRNGRVFAGLMAQAAREWIGDGYDAAVISGTTRQLRLYRHLGFVPFGPLVGTPGALYQPMYLTREMFDERRGRAEVAVSLLPGPVAIAPEVRRALSVPPISHRDPAFAEALRRMRESLCRLTGASNVAVLLGSGTLANDVVAGQLALRPGQPGVVLANGEFGERLIDHAERWGLQHTALRMPWGQPFRADDVARAIDATGARWLWAVHGETSTGMHNDLGLLREVCAPQGVRLCLDCVSSLGAGPLDLTSVDLSTGVSGKSLGGYTGLSMVFYREIVKGESVRRLPRYLDLAMYADEAEATPFSHSSNLVEALAAALERVTPAAWERRAVMMAELRVGLRALGCTLVTDDTRASPAVVTFSPPRGESATMWGERLERRGYLLNFRSGYLRERDWMQVALMGAVSPRTVRELLVEMAGSDN